MHSKLPPNRRPAKGPLLDAARQFHRIDPANDNYQARTDLEWRRDSEALSFALLTASTDERSEFYETVWRARSVLQAANYAASLTADETGAAAELEYLVRCAGLAEELFVIEALNRFNRRLSLV